MILQPRDRNILAALSRYGILSSRQIGELFFKTVRHTTMMRRMRALEKEKFIMRARGMPDWMCSWYLGATGAKAIGAEEPIRYTNQNIVFHEVTLSSVRLVLESMGIAHDFTTETELRRQMDWRRDDPKNATRVIPDGVFVAEKSGRPHVVALEIELQPKNHARLHKVFTEYATMSAFRRIFYVVGSKSIVNLIVSEWQKVRHFDHSPDLFVCLLDELKRDKEKTRAFDRYGTSSPLDMVFDCKKSLLSPSRGDGRETTHGVSGKDDEELSRQAS